MKTRKKLKELLAIALVLALAFAGCGDGGGGGNGGGGSGGYTENPDGGGEQPRSGVSHIRSIAYGNGKFIAASSSLGFSSEEVIAYSADGINWTKAANNPFGTGGIDEIAFGNGKFVAVGTQSRMAYSSDGINWTAVANSPFH